MSGTLTPLGGVTMGGVLPTTLGAFGAVEAQLNFDLASAGNLQIQLDLGPPELAAAVEMGAEVDAQIVASVTEPYFGLAIDANLGAIAAINAQLAALAGIVAALGAAGIDLYLYQGTADSEGSTLQSALSGGLPGGLPGDHVDSLILIARTPEAFAAMQLLMKTS